MSVCVCVCVCVCSEVEGRDRLVKVDKQDKLAQLASQLGELKIIAAFSINRCHEILFFSLKFQVLF